MEKLKAFEQYLFGDRGEEEYDLYDEEFWVDRLVVLPSIRPFELDKAVSLCTKYCNDDNFRRKLLGRIQKCPVLMYKLFKKGSFEYSEIETVLANGNSYISCYYFRHEILNFEVFLEEKIKPDDLDESFLENMDDIGVLIEYGYLPSSLEYCLKYDDIENFRKINILDGQAAKWSPFEWSYKPDSLGLLSFSGFFGSFHCFKYLLVNGYNIDDNVKSLIVCSGSLDLFHLCHENSELLAQSLFKAIEFFRLSEISFFIENGIQINKKMNNLLTPLHIAAQKGHLCVVENLLARGSDIKAYDKDIE